MCTIPAERYGAAFTVTVFGYNAFGHSLVCVFVFIVVCITVKEKNYVSILFDRTGVTQV